MLARYMLLRLKVRNFKRFDSVDIDLSQSVVFIGPNNSGKTSALQAIALWDAGLRLWNSKRGGKASPKKRPGVTLNRRDLIAIPVPVSTLLWRGTHVRDVQKINGSNQTRNVRIDIAVEGVTNGADWSCGLEFDYSNEESFVCRPLRLDGYEDMPVGAAEYSEIPAEASQIRVAYLPPMSGLADREFIKQQGEIGVLIGQGQTAQILRNLCYQLYQRDDKVAWSAVKAHIANLFGVELLDPDFMPERSEIVMEYKEFGTRLDLASSGRGLQQTLLLLAFLHANPNTVLLLDEPDAHLEILRQRQIYRLLTDTASEQGSQVIAASHSEVVLEEAAGRGKVVGFVGSKPRSMNDRGQQILKSITTIGWDQYVQAEEKGWVLYLEGASDLAILQTFARTLAHPAAESLQMPFVHYVATNVPQKARDHFYGLREAKPDLRGAAIFDRLEKELAGGAPLHEAMWSRREIENYFCSETVLIAWARNEGRELDLFGIAEADERETVMRETIAEVTRLLDIDGQQPWSADVKATDDVLDRVFRVFFKRLDLPVTLRKTDYHTLAALVPASEIASEVVEMLDIVVQVAKGG